jgi:hypothetical protein
MSVTTRMLQQPPSCAHMRSFSNRDTPTAHKPTYTHVSQNRARYAGRPKTDEAATIDEAADGSSGSWQAAAPDSQLPLPSGGLSPSPAASAVTRTAAAVALVGCLASAAAALDLLVESGSTVGTAVGDETGSRDTTSSSASVAAAL